MAEVQRPGAGAAAEVAVAAGAAAVAVVLAAAVAEAEAEAEAGTEAVTPAAGRLAQTNPCDTRLATKAVRILAFHGADDVCAISGTGMQSARKRPRFPLRRVEDSHLLPVIRPAAVKRPAKMEDTLWGG
tara:strand:+ start:150 stop:536 length:387 start_codon:yes stop_codon:yes gene_type:complete